MFSAENRLFRVVEKNLMKELFIELRAELRNPLKIVMHPETNNIRKLFLSPQKKARDRAVSWELESPLTLGKGNPTGAVAIGGGTQPLLKCNLAGKDH